jgi:hypothetical protein
MLITVPSLISSAMPDPTAGIAIELHVPAASTQHELNNPTNTNNQQRSDLTSPESFVNFISAFV